MKYNIVTNYRINQIIKQSSKYYKVHLGHAITMDSNRGDRELNKGDDFAFFYNTLYKASVLGQGIIGDIKFYTDHVIMEDLIAFYIDREEFIYEFDEKMIKEKGIDSFLGSILKKSEDEYKERKQKEKDDAEQIVKEKGNAEKVTQNPGNVTYEDVKAFLEQKNSGRLKV